MSHHLYVYMFRSRNKDNKHLPYFHERCKFLLAYEKNEDMVYRQYLDFVSLGLEGEKTRLYRSVNARNEEKVREGIIIRLLKDKPSVTSISRIVASVAQQSENRAESKWLIDFDVDDDTLLESFLADIPVDTEVHKTPNGYAIVCEHGFDTRELFHKWNAYDITLKKDEMLFLAMETNENACY